MNFLNHLSWSSYFQIIILLLAFYYAFIGVRFYAADLHRLLRRLALPAVANQRMPDELLFNGGETVDDGLPHEVSQRFASHPDNDIREADELMETLNERITLASDKAQAPDALVLQLKADFKAHAWLKNSAHRMAINELVVTECARTGVTELTEDEVDQWWSD